MDTVAGVGIFGFIFAAFVLFVLAILMPWYVYRSTVYLKDILKELREINANIKGNVDRFKNMPLE